MTRAARRVGFHALPPLDAGALVELTRGPDTAASAAAAAERFFATLGKHTEWVGDAPGLVLGRIVCQVINEAAFALGEGVGSAEDIDAGMVHGLNYPRGILAWADEIGLDHVLGVLDALGLERGEERYRAAPLLRRLGWSGRLGRATGEGFFTYDARRHESGHLPGADGGPGRRASRSPSCESRDDAIVAIEASGICGSDLHIYHGRVKMEPGFTIGHEFVGTGGRRRRRGDPRRGRRPGAAGAFTPPAARASSACAASIRSATGCGCSVTARRWARCRARRPTRRSCRWPT